MTVTLFSAKLGFYAEKPYADTTTLYVYVQRNGSLVMSGGANRRRIGFEAAYDTTYWLKERTESGYLWTQYDVIWHWMNWCQLDGKAWYVLPKVYALCDKKSVRKGIVTMLKRKFKAVLRKR